MLNLINLGAGGHGNGVFHGADFRFPVTNEYRLALAHGFNGFRVAHKWHRLQMPAGQAGPTNNVDEYKKSIGAGRTMSPDAMFVIEDHSYGAAIPLRHVSGSFTNWNDRAKFDYDTTPVHTVETAKALAQFYGRVFPEYKDVPQVAFECGNEMVKIQGVAPSMAVQNAFFDEMRAQGFVKNTLIGTTSGWGGITQLKAEAAALKGLRCNVVSVHRYFDPGNEGNESKLWNLTDADATRADLGAIVNSKLTEERENLLAARAAGLQLLVGEYGVPNTALGLAVLEHMLRFFKEFSDVIWGLAPWIAAEWSSDDAFAKIIGTGPSPGMVKHLEVWTKVMGGVTPPPPVVPPTGTAPTQAEFDKLKAQIVELQRQLTASAARATGAEEALTRANEALAAERQARTTVESAMATATARIAELEARPPVAEPVGELHKSLLLALAEVAVTYLKGKTTRAQLLAMMLKVRDGLL